jgi:hypothetical protein
MITKIWIFAAAFALSGAAMAQSGAMEITDPAKIAAIEAHAQQLTARGHSMMESHDKMGKHAMHHKKHKMAHKAKAKKAEEAPPAADSKG